jgi:anti-sigma B factor antagonist
MSLLDIRVAPGDAGPVMMLSGEADMTNRAQLEDALNAQITSGASILTVDLSGLSFADSATIGALTTAARALKARGGRLDLLNPRPGLAHMLTLLGVDQILTVRGSGPGPGHLCPGRPNDASDCRHSRDFTPGAHHIELLRDVRPPAGPVSARPAAASPVRPGIILTRR